MKCRSVACIWSGTPPPQRVTAVASLSHPPTFYTGGSDGSIIWWNISFSDSNPNSPEIKPVAMLCGHASAITDLGVCSPLTVPEEQAQASANSISRYGDLISACKDGMLCVWSRSSGHCRCRRKLPPWAGSPSLIRTLCSRPRYVCIACCFLDANSCEYNTSESAEGGQCILDSESLHQKPSKCTILVIDTRSLSVIQTIYEGNLSVGPMKFMEVVSDDKNREESVVIVDSVGRIQTVSLLKDPYDQVDTSNNLHQCVSQPEVYVWEEEISNQQQIVSIAIKRNIVAFVWKNRCIFRLLSTGATISDISFLESLCSSGEDSAAQPSVVGAMFLENCDAWNIPSNHKRNEAIVEYFVAWSSRGAALVYSVSFLNGSLKCEPCCEIPATSLPLSKGLKVTYFQLNQYLVRAESICFRTNEPLMWKPHVTLWSLQHFDGERGPMCQKLSMLGRGGCLTDWFKRSSMHVVELDGQETKSTDSDCFAPGRKDINDNRVNNLNDGNVYEDQIVSSSMVIFENFFTPYAAVYGFVNGKIEVVPFESFEGLSSQAESPSHEEKSNACKQYFSGHTGAVLCLAAHQMVGNDFGSILNRILVSGSTDTTVRIWDLDRRNLVIVLHHHVAPVRQIILPPSLTESPWSHCFLSVGEDSCIALVSLETLRVERMFPGHTGYPVKVVWDGGRGYIASLCQAHSGASDAAAVLYIWDVKTGARERILHGTAAYSMFDHFCQSMDMKSTCGTLLNNNTSVSSLLLPLVEDGKLSHSSSRVSEILTMPSSPLQKNSKLTEPAAGKRNSSKPLPTSPFADWENEHPVKCSCPFPGIVALSFDLASLMFSHLKYESSGSGVIQENIHVKQHGNERQNPAEKIGDKSDVCKILKSHVEEHDLIRSFEEYLLQFSLSFLHLWNVDPELDNLLVSDMKLKRPENFLVASGLQGDKGSLTLTFPCLDAILELWKSSAEFSAMRCLTMVSLAQRLICLSHPSSEASSALAAFYTRNFMEKLPDIKPPSLQLLVGFWQDESEHVCMAARSIFHCAASKVVPLPLSCSKAVDVSTDIIAGNADQKSKDSTIENLSSDASYFDPLKVEPGSPPADQSKLIAWMESFEIQDWISCVGGTSQDVMTAHIIVAAALAIWYPSLVKPSLAMLAVHPLIKLAMSMNEKYSSTAAELLAEGMESTWKQCIDSEIPRMIGDIFFQIELSGPSINSAKRVPAAPLSIRKTLVEVLLPSLAIADIPGFLTVIESQIWSTASDSPVHLVSLMTLVRVMRGSPRNLGQYLDKVVNFILQTVDPSNTVMRKTCFHSSMTALKEVVREYPMVALNESWTRLAVGDVIGEIKHASIRVYDMQSVTKIKLLDASGPPGLPSLLPATSETTVTTAISALSFSPDGEGLIAFSEHGMMIRWWSLGSVWWEKLTRNLVPVQCTKLIFVPPCEGFSPKSSRSSIMANISGNDRHSISQDARDANQGDCSKQLIHNLDLSYRLGWTGQRQVTLTRHGHELGIFQL